MKDIDLGPNHKMKKEMNEIIHRDDPSISSFLNAESTSISSQMS